MWPHFENIPLQAPEFTILRDLIQQRAGMFFDNDKRELLAEKLAGRVVERGFRTFLDYYYLLKYGPNAESEWPQVFDALSVQETYFWREMDQIHALSRDILPQYAASCPDQPIQIWCAACATGEEPLTIAMALWEADWLARLPIRIVASDASPAAIAKARRGVYRERSFRTLPKTLQDRYFAQVAGGWQVAAALSSRIELYEANLMRPEEIEPFARSPFIFCRNVFIYFAPRDISRTVNLFARNMPRPGYLFVGASESLLRLNTEFELHTAGDAFVYRLT
jgi:chemotaxis protein methyltransferase CheR